MDEEVKPKPYEIRSESDLFACIKRFEAGQWNRSGELIFLDWPRYESRICRKKFDGGNTMRIIPAFMALQHEIDPGYSRSVYGKVLRLTKEEKRETKPIVPLEPGSTI